MLFEGVCKNAMHHCCNAYSQVAKVRYLINKAIASKFVNNLLKQLLVLAWKSILTFWFACIGSYERVSYHVATIIPFLQSIGMASHLILSKPVFTHPWHFKIDMKSLRRFGSPSPPFPCLSVCVVRISFVDCQFFCKGKPRKVHLMGSLWKRKKPLTHFNANISYLPTLHSRIGECHRSFKTPPRIRLYA